MIGCGAANFVATPTHASDIGPQKILGVSTMGRAAILIHFYAGASVVGSSRKACGSPGSPSLEFGLALHSGDAGARRNDPGL